MISKKISKNAIKTVTKNLNESITDNYVSLVCMINSTDFVMSFSKNRKSFLYVSLNNSNPYLCLINDTKLPQIFANKHNDYLKKYIKDAHIEQVIQLNDDRIIEIAFKKTNNIFEREDLYLILELIPHHANLIILDKDRKIVYAFGYKGIETPRPILNSLSYVLPNKMDYEDSSNLTVNEIYETGKNLFFEALQKRKSETFKPLYQFINSRIKALNKKIKILEKEIENNREYNFYKDVGDTLLMYQDDKPELYSYVESNNIVLDPKLSITQNANLYFKKFKKYKRSLIENENQINIAREEIKEFELRQNMLQFLNDDELYELMAELLHTKSPTQKKLKNISSSILIGKSTIYFGKNAKQNDKLTFHQANKDHYFFHIKDYHGPHVVLAESNPDSSLIEKTAQITLALSNKEDGEVQYCQIKNIKKGPALGLAILNNYKTLFIREINKDLLEEIKNRK